MRALLGLLICIAAIHCTALPSLHASPANITVSGISSGGAMAIQLGFAHSAKISGVGAVAGPPYYCAQGQLTTAFLSCMYGTMAVGTSAMANYAENQATSGNIDPLEHLKDQRVWLYSGISDTVVKQSVVDAGASFYETYSNNVFYEHSVNSEHAWITESYGNDCSYLGSPFMNHCNLDAAGKILQFTMGISLFPPTSDPHSHGNLTTFSQDLYTSNPSGISMGPEGYIYIPFDCQKVNSGCHIHIALHGCQMDLDSIGTDFIEHSNIINWAATNKLIVLFPQVQKSTLLPANPEACFDWWGYNEPSYATQSGSQIEAIWRMVEALT